jgi:Tol biopolymer transport system component
MPRSATGRAALLFIVAVMAAACSAQAPQTSRPTPVSTEPPDHAPAGLPPGKLLFSKGGIDLWTAAPDGSGRIGVTTDGALAGGYIGARWSPDGTLIAAERLMPGDGGSSLFLVRRGAGAVRLTKPETFLDGYAWSPDGRYITYGEVTSGGTAAAGGSLAGAIGDVHLYDVTTSTDMVVGPGTHPAFTPDGTRLGYAHVSGAIALADLRVLASGRPKEFPTQILVTLADLTRYSTASAPKGMGLIGGPVFSADGKLVAYAAIEKGPILDAVQLVYTQELAVGAPPKVWVIGKTGAIHHVAELRWSPVAPLLAYSIINAQPHHHWISVIDPASGQRRELYDSAKHFLDFTWSPDGALILVQVDDGDEWLYFRPDRSGPIGRVAPGGWRPDWCRCAPRA